jgi:hypothetical protein
MNVDKIIWLLKKQSYFELNWIVAYLILSQKLQMSKLIMKIKRNKLKKN